MKPRASLSIARGIAAAALAARLIIIFNVGGAVSQATGSSYVVGAVRKSHVALTSTVLLNYILVTLSEQYLPANHGFFLR